VIFLLWTVEELYGVNGSLCSGLDNLTGSALMRVGIWTAKLLWTQRKGSSSFAVPRVVLMFA
jgi:hypothetical protein